MKNKYKIVSIILISIILIILSFYYSLRGTQKSTDYYTPYYNNLIEKKIGNDEYVQQIVASNNNLTQINIYLRYTDLLYTTAEKYREVDLELGLYDVDNNLIEEYKVGKVFFEEFMYIPFTFQPIENSKDNTYYLHIKSIIDNNDLILELAESYDDNVLTINNDSSDYSVIYRTVYKINNTPLYLYIVPFIMILLIGIVLFLINKSNIEKKYLLISLVVGILLAIVTPAYCGHDELSHFARIYSISKGNIVINSEDKWPEIDIPYKYITIDSVQYYNLHSITSYKNDNWDYIEHDLEDMVKFDMQYSSVYSPLSYIPQTIVYSLSSIIISNPAILLFIARIVQLIFCIYIMYNAIKITPFGKSIFMFIGILPSTLQAMCLLSIDGILIAFFMLLIAKILQLSYSNKTITKKDYLILAISSIFVAITKLVYLPLCFLLILIPLNRKEKNLSRNIGIIIVISFLMTFLWNLIATRNLVSGQGINFVYYIQRYLNNPVEFVQITTWTFTNQIGRLISDIFGAVNDWHGTIIQDGGVVPILFFIIFMIYIFRGENKLKNRDKKIIGIILIITYLIISTVLHLTCTPVNYKYIIGIQGRYFIPFLVCIYLIFNKNSDNKIDDNKYSYICILLELYYCLYIFSYFIIMFSRFD